MQPYLELVELIPKIYILPVYEKIHHIALKVLKQIFFSLIFKVQLSLNMHRLKNNISQTKETELSRQGWRKGLQKIKVDLCRLLMELWFPKKNGLLLVAVCQAIHLEAVLVPQYKFRGQNATLLCKYELEPDEELFSLKWYKEETEFYRFTPNDQISQPYQHYYDRSRSLQNNHHRSRQSRRQVAAPPEDDQDYSDYSSGTFLNSKVNYQEQQMRLDGQVQTWKVPGIKIDVSSLPILRSQSSYLDVKVKAAWMRLRGLLLQLIMIKWTGNFGTSHDILQSELSTPQRVVLKRVSFKSTGMYRCEVTAVLRRSGGYGHIPIQSFKMKESINRMIVVGKLKSLHGSGFHCRQAKFCDPSSIRQIKKCASLESHHFVCRPRLRFNFQNCPQLFR